MRVSARSDRASLGRLALFRRRTARAWSFLLLVLGSLALLVAGKFHPGLTEATRAAVNDVVAPVMEALAAPTRALSSGIESVERFLDVYDENDVLRKRNAELSQWRDRALDLMAENLRLRELANYRSGSRPAEIAVRVVGDSTGVFVRSVLTDVGTDGGLAKGNAVVDGSGVVGHVVEAGRRSARILLVTDLNSRIPVVVRRTRLSAIAVGNNGSTLTLRYLRPGSDVRPGDRIVTSGHGHVFPPDLPVGEVVSGDGRIAVRPVADLHRLDYVRVLAFPDTEIGGRRLPDAVRPARHAGRR